MIEALDMIAKASMGPRFCKRGNYCIISFTSPPAALQWGHAFVSVETSRTIIGDMRNQRFNGATLL